MFEHAAKNFEGMVSKRADAPYRSERTDAWVKVKTVQKENSRTPDRLPKPGALLRLTVRRGRLAIFGQRLVPIGQRDVAEIACGVGRLLQILEREPGTFAVEHLAKGICTPSKRDVGLRVMRKLQLTRPALGELLDHVPVLVKAYGKWPSYVYLFVMSLWTPLVVVGASWLAWKGWR